MSSTGHLPELDLLRSQVADLSCQLAERDRTLHEQSRNLAREGQDLREQSEMLHAIVGGTASETGEDFFPALVTQLTSVLEVQYAVVGVVQGDSIKKIRTIAVSAGGALIDNFEYALTNTPCETALGQSFACFERDVRTAFPEFQRAVPLSVEGYCGVALRAKGGAVIGLLVVMDVKPLRNTDFLKSLMTVMASRAGAELQRQQAEMGLRQQLSHLAEAQALAHLGSWNWDIDSGDVQWSDEQFRIFGHEPGAVAVTYDTLLISLHPDDHDRVLAAINDALMGKTSLDTECHIVRPNGDVRFVLTRGEVRRDTTGHPLRMAGITLDISEQKQIKEALRTSEELWQLAVRGSNDGIWDWHIQAGKVFYSSRWRAMRGFADHEIGDSLDDWRSHIHPDDLDRVLRSVDAYLAKERPEFCEEYRVQKKDGSYLWILDRGVAHWNEAGRPTRMVGSEADITERKRAEEVLRQYSSQQHAIAQFGQFSLREHGLQTVMDEAVRRIAQTLETDYCKVLELRPDSATLLLKAGVGWHDGLVGQATVSAGGDSQAGYTLSVREPVIVEDLRTDQRFSGPPLLLDHGVVSGLSVIIQGEYRPWGVLGVHTTTRRTFTQDEVAFVQAMANILGSVIERNAAEEALRVSEGRLSAFMINSPSPVFCKSWDGRYLYVNPEFERLFQLPADHIIGKTDYDIFLPEQADQFAVNDRQVIHEEHAIEFEETATYYDGIHVSLVVKFPLPDADGAVNGLIGGIVTDITPRKRAEEALRSSQEKLRQALQASSTGLWDWNTETNEVSLSREWKRQLGYEEAELTDDFETWETRLHPDDHARAIAYMRAYLAKPVGDYQQEFRLRHKDGTYRWIETRASFVTEPDGRQIRLLGSHTDITARKQTEEALRVGEERYARATAVGKVGVWELDVNAGIYHSDANLKALFGYAPDELSTDPYRWLNLVHPDDRPVAMASWERIVSGVTDAYHYELRMVRKDGTVIWTEVRGHAVREQDGRLTHLIGATVDITDRKEAENALTASERQLRTVLDALPIGVWFTDRTGQSILANPAAKHIWSNIKRGGLQTADNSRGWWETIEGAGNPHRWALSHPLTSTEPSLNETLDLECLDGTRKTIRYKTVPVQDENGAVLGAIVLTEDITALQQAQEALKLTQFSVDHSVEGFFWIGADARILHVNDAACRMLEYTRDELTAMTLHDIDPTCPPEHWAVHWEELKQKGSMTFESKQWSRTGRVLDTEVTVNYLQYEGKEYNCAIMRDVGERKRTHEELRISEERFRTMFAQAPIGMALIDSLTGKQHEVNPKIAQIAGRTTEEIRGLDWMSITHPDDVQADLENMARLIAGEIAGFQMEKRYVRPDGTVAWINLIVAPIQVEEHAGPRHLAMVEDITGRKRAEQALRESRDLFEKAFRSSPYPIVLSELESGRIVDANDASLKLFGYSREDISERTTTDIGLWLAPEHRRRFVERVKENGSIRNVEVSLRDQTGKIRECLVSVELIELQGEHCMVTVGQDITERKRAAEALRRRERDLRVALEERERISQDLHDGILQSLYAVGLGLEACRPLLAQRRENATTKLMVTFNQAIGQLNHVMAEVRNFIAGLESQVIHGGDFSTALQTMVQTMSLASSTKCRVIINAAASRRISTEQALHLINVVREALSNSLRHSEAKKTTVSLKQLVRSVRLSVTDDGIGFDPGTAHGVGHGLTNMALRAQKIGGRFAVRSKPGYGTKILLDLPKETLYARN